MKACERYAVSVTLAVPTESIRPSKLAISQAYFLPDAPGLLSDPRSLEVPRPERCHLLSHSPQV